MTLEVIGVLGEIGERPLLIELVGDKDRVGDGVLLSDAVKRDTETAALDDGGVDDEADT